jgi:hypothetical protein
MPLREKENFSALSKSIHLDRMHSACLYISSGDGGGGGVALGNYNSELKAEDFLSVDSGNIVLFQL